MSELKKGDRVRIRYWDELPEIPDTEWVDIFFERYGGKIGEAISDKYHTFPNTEKIEIKLENESIMVINIYALMKLNILPDELFEI